MKRIFGALALVAAGPVLAIQPGGTAAPQAAAPPAAAPDPARIAAAERLVDLVLPTGAPMNILLGNTPNAYSMMDTRIGDLSMSPEDQALGPDMTFGDFMTRTDPHFRERMRITREVTDRMVHELLPNLEADFRRAAAAMFARRFTTAEIDEMIVFFATPAGRKYATLNLTILTDPALARVIQSITPAMEQASPSLDERVRAATAHIPEQQPDPGDAAPSPDEPPSGG